MNALDKTLCRHLKRYLADKVWNEPQSEGRSNTKPKLYGGQSWTGHFYYSGLEIELPQTDRLFYVYTCPIALFSGLLPEETGWVRCDRMCNEFDATVDLYSVDGYMFPKGASWVYYSEIFGLYFFCIEKKAVNAHLPHERVEDICATLYLDSDVLGDVQISSFAVPDVDTNYTHRGPIIQAMNSCASPLVYVNGELRDVVTAADIPLGAYVDVIQDDDTIVDYTVDISEDPHVFFSEMDEHYKYLIHTPKALNPENKVLTHNTADFYVYRKSDHVGRYLHRCGKVSVDQITHNDFSIPQYILDAYRDYFSDQDISVRVRIRQHQKNNVLIDEASFISYLYMQSDTEIVRCLMGGGDDIPPYWRASELEASSYVRCFFDVANGYSPSTMTSCIAALGFYNALSLLCGRVTSFIYSSLQKKKFIIDKPLLYWDEQVYPVVSVNGNKIRDVNVEYTNKSTYFTVEVGDSVHISPGDTVTVEMFLDDLSRKGEFAPSYVFTPDFDNTYLYLPYTDFKIYRKNDEGPVLAKGVDYESSETWSEVTDFIGSISVLDRDVGVGLDFHSPTHGETFLVQCETSIIHKEYDVQENISNGDPLVFNLETYNTLGGEVVPVLSMSNFLLYLNGRYLQRDLDYSVVEVKVDERVSVVQILMLNFSYLNPDGENKVELIGVRADDEERLNGFVYEDTVGRKKPNSMYYSTLSTLYVEGKLERDIVDHGEYLSLPSGKYREGAPYEIVTRAAHSVKSAIERYYENRDNEKLIQLAHYLYGKGEEPDGLVLIEHSHVVYSVYLATIIRDILNGTIPGVAYDSDPEQMLSQVENYSHIREMDHTLRETVDLGYVDVIPTYADFSVLDIPRYKAIRRLCEIILPDDSELGPDTMV